METFRIHKYDIPLVRGGHLEGPHVFGFLIHGFPLRFGSKRKGHPTTEKYLSEEVLFQNLNEI